MACLAHLFDRLFELLSLARGVLAFLLQLGVLALKAGELLRNLGRLLLENLCSQSEAHKDRRSRVRAAHLDLGVLLGELGRRLLELLAAPFLRSALCLEVFVGLGLYHTVRTRGHHKSLRKARTTLASVSAMLQRER